MGQDAQGTRTRSHAADPSSAETPPFITVVIATCNRGGAAARTIDSILDNPYPSFALEIVDQSDDDATRESLSGYATDPRFRYRHIVTKGMAHARNSGVSRASSELIAITDDDCEVPGDWLHTLAESFARDPRIGIVFGNVLAGPFDPEEGFVPTYIRDAPRLITRTQDKHRADGIGACMGLRKSVWKQTGGFDGRFGRGAPLQGNSEGEFAIRALERNSWILENPAFFTIHHGFRTWSQRKDLVHGYWFGTGAMYGKHFRRSPWQVSKLLGPLAWRWAFGTSRVTSSLGLDKQRLRRLLAFSRGFYQGMSRC